MTNDVFGGQLWFVLFLFRCSIGSFVKWIQYSIHNEALYFNGTTLSKSKHAFKTHARLHDFSDFTSSATLCKQRKQKMKDHFLDKNFFFWSAWAKICTGATTRNSIFQCSTRNKNQLPKREILKIMNDTRNVYLLFDYISVISNTASHSKREWWNHK